MKSTPLYENHKKLNCKFTEFAGYQMPVSYGAIKDEALAVRNQCGIFDVSHMLPISLKGNHADLIAELNRVTVRSVEKIKPGKVQYNALYNEKGGLIDDITISHIPTQGNESHFLIVANAGNRDADLAHLRKYLSAEKIRIEPWENYTLLALQGPKAESFLKNYFPAASELFYYECVQIAEHQFIARTGYTGEDGFEIITPTSMGADLFDKLIAAGVKPCGLAARDILRLEALMPLYGHELSVDLRPQESGIEFIYEDKNSIATSAIRNAAVQYKTLGFSLGGEGVPRQGYKIVTSDGNEAGVVTSGGFSFVLDKGFGFMRVLRSALSAPLFIEIRGEKKPITVQEKSFIQGSVKRRPKSAK